MTTQIKQRQWIFGIIFKFNVNLFIGGIAKFFFWGRSPLQYRIYVNNTIGNVFISAQPIPALRADIIRPYIASFQKYTLRFRSVR